MTITQGYGNWNEFGSAEVKIENYPVNYNGTNLELEVSLTLLELNEDICQLLKFCVFRFLVDDRWFQA